MKETDFVDEDLVERHVSPVGGADISPGRDLDEDSDVPVVSISDLSLGKLARHRQQVSHGMASAVNQIEQLRRKQTELEQQKSDLEEMDKRQREYERGKREVTELLSRGAIALEKKEVLNSQLGEVLSSTRNRFKAALEEIGGIEEGRWAEEHFRDELYKALVIVEDARMEYNKALAKIKALEDEREPMPKGRALGMAGGEAGGARGFMHWFYVGLAASLPLMIFVGVLGLLRLVLLINGW